MSVRNRVRERAAELASILACNEWAPSTAPVKWDNGPGDNKAWHMFWRAHNRVLDTEGLFFGSRYGTDSARWARVEAELRSPSP